MFRQRSTLGLDTRLEHTAACGQFKQAGVHSGACWRRRSWAISASSSDRLARKSLLGWLAWRLLPVAALPQVDYPIIQVFTFQPGAGPEVTARTITAPLERRLGQIPGLKQMHSSSSGGASVITLQFALSVDLGVAEQEVQAAINTASSLLPNDLPTPPIYRKVNPADAPILPKLAEIGIVPGKDFDAKAANPEVLDRVKKISVDRVMLHMVTSGDFKNINGWRFSTKTGLYGTDYMQRALITAVGLGANRPEDAIYPISLKSGSGVFARKYNGANKYVMHFPKGQLPPVKGFWSLTMYDDKYFFVANPINRYSISARQNLKANADGSIDLYVQHDTPGADKESNWLPAPAGEFILMLRMYWPNPKKPSILDGTWTIPEVTAS